MAQTFWPDVADGATVQPTDTILIRRPGSQNQNRGIALEVPAPLVGALGGGLSDAQVRALITALALALPTRLGAATSVTFSDDTYRTVAGQAVPAAALWLRFVLHHERVRGTYEAHAGLWRALPAVAPADDQTAANRIPLLQQGLYGTLGLGRTSANVPVIAYDGGFASLPADNVEVYYS